jgi:hypothetical protein
MSTEPPAKLETLLDFLSRLQGAKIWYCLKQIRDEAIMVEVSVPGKRWEIEFMRDGTIEVERFKSNGEIFGAAAIEELFNRFSD